MKSIPQKPFAEVIESSLYGFLAQSWAWDTFPTFGSLVIVESNKKIFFGIVHEITTGSMDAVRYPFPYQKTEEELLKEQPQIFEFLKTTFSCLLIGYQEKGSLYYLVAPEPPKIHAFVSNAPLELSKQFFYSNKYLHVLFSLANKITAIDELLLAIIKQQIDLSILTKAKLTSIIDAYCLMTGNDYRRLKTFLQRVEPLLEKHPIT